MEDLIKDKEELQKLLETAQREFNKKLLARELKNIDAYIADQAEKDEEHKKLQAKRGETEHEKIYSLITKYGWSDEGKNVKVYVTDLDGIKEVGSDKITCKFTSNSFELIILGYKGKDLKLSIPALNKEIDADKSKFSIKSSSISITLRKEKEAKWPGLKEGEGAGAGVGGGMPGMGMPGMGMPGMGGAGGMPGMGGAGGMPGMEGLGGMGGEEGAPGMGGGEGGQADMMNMMKKMYEEGDENTKKMMTEAMMKGQQDQK